MARVPYVDDLTNPELEPVADRIRAERGGRLPNLYRVLLNSPKLAEGWLHLFTVVRQQCTLPAQYRELVIMAIAVLNGADYEYRHHAPIALASGLTQAQIDELPQWRQSSLYDPTQRAVLDYAESMTRNVQVPDAVFEAVRRALNARMVVELTATIAGYNLVSRFLEALKVDLE